MSFPRGGASALTPLELKQVANEAASDVLFGGKTAETVDESRPKKRKKTGKKTKVETDAAADDEEALDVVQHVNFKNLKVGSLLLGQISAIYKHELCVSFTDNISGFVKITNISEQLTALLEDLDQEMGGAKESHDGKDEEYESSEDEKDDIEEAHSKELPDLNKYFQLGQWLRCSVVLNSTFDTERKKNHKKRIELSIAPSDVNAFVEEDLDKHTAVQCSIMSIEDHGATLDLGIKGTTGFLPKKALPDFEKLNPGSVFLGNIVKKSGRAVTVNFDFNSKNSKVSQVSSIDAVIPGQAVDLLCEDVTKNGIVGKAFGLIPSFLGIGQLRTFKLEELKHKYAVGTSIKCRVIASLLNKNAEKVLLLSILPHILSLDPKLYEKESLESFPVGYKVDSCTVLGRDSSYLYLAVDEERVGQVHSSQIGDVSLQSTVAARVLGYNDIDRLYELSTEPETLKKKYLRSNDVPVGEVISKCEVVTVSSSGIQLNLFNGQFTAFVPPLHISDTRLVYPERKFKIGSKVKGKILNVDGRGRIFVTLKKSLVNLESDADLVSTYTAARNIQKQGLKTVATVQAFQAKGAHLLFFGGIRGFLPNSEISEVFVKKPEDHLRLGKTVVVKIVDVDEERSRIIATCKVSSDEAEQQKGAIDQMVLGRTMVDVTVVEKTKESLVVEMGNVGLRGVIYVGHLSDSRIEQNRAQLKKIRIGLELKALVIDKDVKSQVFNATLKESLIEDAQKSELPVAYEDIKAKKLTTAMHGYIKSISEKGLFVAFNGKFVGLVLPSYAVESRDVDFAKKFYINQSVTTYLLRSDDANQRFLLTLKEPKNKLSEKSATIAAVNPVDKSIATLEDYQLGKVVDAKIKSVKKNQLNVILADNLYGRIDISEVFDRYEDIKDPKQPLGSMKKDDIIKVKVIGHHDVRGHKFLPITHKVTNSTVLELTMRKSMLHDPHSKVQTVEDVAVDQEVLGFVNNYASNNLWLTISPALKAKISVFDLTDDSSKYSKNFEEQYPLGSALKVSIKSVETDHGFIIVTGRSHAVQIAKDVKIGDKLPAKIVKINEKYILLNLGGDVVGISFATDALDDFSVPLKVAFEGMLNQIVPATVLSIDAEKEKIKLSLRSANAKSRQITSHTDLSQGDVVQALVKRVTDKGIFVYLSANLEAFVPVSKLSDSYLKEWKKFYSPMQCVVGKVINSDEDSRILLTLRESEINGKLHVLKNYDDIKVGDIFEGNVKNVTDFGVFVKLDDTVNITGLAHRSEIADAAPENLASLFGNGDRVKAYVIKVNPDKKQISLSLRASHFSNPDSVESKSESKQPHIDEDGDEIMEQVLYNENDSEAEEGAESDGDQELAQTEKPQQSSQGLSLSAGFDWTASILDQAHDEETTDEEDFTESNKSKRRRKNKNVVEDKTIDISTRAPESVADFERLIMGNSNSSVIWMNYMAFQLQLSEVEKAREVAERALKTISFREEDEKLNIWIALLNLENTFGTDESLEEVFKRACQYMDSFVIHNKLLSIYQMSDKFEQAAELFKIAAKKFGSEKVSIWLSWCEFFLSQNQTQEARSLLSNALKALPKRSHIEVVRKFAQLEFSKGDAERGRSLFEGLVADAPKRIDLWNVYLDQEIKAGEKKKVENIFERVIGKKITRKQAKFFFNKWLQFEESQEDHRSAEYVKSKAIEFAEKNPKLESN